MHPNQQNQQIQKALRALKRNKEVHRRANHQLNNMTKVLIYKVKIIFIKSKIMNKSKTIPVCRAKKAPEPDWEPVTADPIHGVQSERETG